ESIKVAILREIFEETGLELKEKDISHIKEVFIKYKHYDFVYHIFNTKVNKEPKVKINNKEHKAYKWIKPKEALKMDLIEDLDACIKLFYK
ncbi:MAG: putative pyrophosphohydrolase, partial [candidate division WS6 bacterium 34_10]